jgi:Putative zinc-finger
MQRFTHKESSPPGPPAEHWPSDEDLAAYIDGNLDQAESKRIVEHLASCEDCYAVYIGAVRFKLETDPAPVDNVVRFPSREEARRGWRISAMAAAVLLAAVASGWYYLAGPLPALAVAQIAETIQGKPEQMGNLWLGPTSRGAGGSEEEIPLDPAAFQIGVQLVNLQVSLKANQGEQAQDVVARILQNLETQMFVDNLKEGYKGITSDIANGTPPTKLTGKASELAGQVREVFAAPLYLDLGQWVEAGRLAAISHDPAFFHLPASRSFLRHALWRDRLGRKNSKLPEKSRMELYEIGRILDKGDPQPGDYPKLLIRFNKILAAEYPD